MAYFEQIEAYIADKLAPAERAAFEEQLKNDSTLKQEVDLQKDIINAIKTSRHAQLKSNLSQVAVGSAASSASPWWIAAASSALIAGAIGLYMMNSNTTAPQVPIIAKTNTVETVIPSENISDGKLTEAKESLPIVSAPEKTGENFAKEKKGIKTVATAKEPISEAQSPDVDMPDADITSSEIGNNTPIIKRDAVVPSNQTLVEINDTDKSKFHYQSSNGKLTLYGNFKTSPYELIEIHSSTGDAVYLKFEKQYYSILNNQKQMRKLTAIHDKALLLKLSKVNNK